MKTALFCAAMMIQPHSNMSVPKPQLVQCVGCSIMSHCGPLAGCVINGRCKPEMVCPK